MSANHVRNLGCPGSIREQVRSRVATSATSAGQQIEHSRWSRTARDRADRCGDGGFLALQFRCKISNDLGSLARHLLDLVVRPNRERHLVRGPIAFSLCHLAIPPTRRRKPDYITGSRGLGRPATGPRSWDREDPILGPGSAKRPRAVA
jgi:hypothetical protein